MTGSKPQTSGLEATALPTDPQPLPSKKYLFFEFYVAYGMMFPLAI